VVVTRTVVSVIGVVMISLGSAAPADPRGGSLSPDDRCAIAKLEPTAREATCMAEPQIRGVGHKLTDEQVDAQQVACQEATGQAFEIAEGEAGDSACPTIGDADVIGYALALATRTVTSCPHLQERAGTKRTGGLRHRLDHRSDGLPTVRRRSRCTEYRSSGTG
jgi:hypothetical protein